MIEPAEEPVEDTPFERDAKAEVLIQIAANKAEQLAYEAEKLAYEVKRFRWEVRGYCAIFFLFIVSQIF
jgi:hypothetical protein